MLIRLVKLAMINIECIVRIKGCPFEEYTSDNGVRQGDTLGCLLVTIGFEKVVR